MINYTSADTSDADDLLLACRNVRLGIVSSTTHTPRRGRRDVVQVSRRRGNLLSNHCFGKCFVSVLKLNLMLMQLVFLYSTKSRCHHETPCSAFACAFPPHSIQFAKLALSKGVFLQGFYLIIKLFPLFALYYIKYSSSLSRYKQILNMHCIQYNLVGANLSSRLGLIAKLH